MLTATAWLGFLSDEQRSVYHGPAALRRVETLLRRPAGNPDSDPENVYVAANLLALTVFRMGQTATARQICRDEIAYALRRRDTPQWPLMAMYALQPQINLFRIQGYSDELELALDGLSRLECLAAGQAAALPELTLDGATVRSMIDGDLPLRSLARNVRVADTCKILWRHGLHDRLLDVAERLGQLWPHASTRDMPQHAAEAPWLVSPQAQVPLPTDALVDQPVPQRRLAYVRLLHLAAYLVASGSHEEAARIAVALYEHRRLLDDRFASALTPLRCLGSLADTLHRVGHEELAVPLLEELLIRPEIDADAVLSRGIRARLGIESPRPAGDAPAAGDLVAAVQERLSS